MKVKNDLISIKIGKKQYDFKNLILDEYLNRIIKHQIDVENLTKVHCDIDLKYLLIKFDTPLQNVETSMDLHNQDFDICLLKEAVSEQEATANSVSIKYTYTSNPKFLVHDYSQETYINISNYYGRKITAIGFNSWNGNDEGWTNPWPVCAVLDTSNYNLYLQENELFTVVRKDIFLTDADFYSTWPTMITGPAHLCPKGVQSPREWLYITNYYGILKSIGFGYDKNKMIEEFLVGTDVEVTQNDNELIIQTLSNSDVNHNLIYPKNNLFSSSNLFMLKENYKLILLKYEIYRIEYVETEQGLETNYIDMEEYYLQSLPIANFGSGNIKIKYERG